MHKISACSIVLALLFIVCTTLFSCAKKETVQNPFAIENGRIGLLTPDVKVYQLDSIFASDSIVKRVAGDEFINQGNEIEIFETSGKPLLVLTPKEEFDSTSTITAIQILDPRYKTSDSLSLQSTFQDFQKHHQISKISNMLSTALVFVDSLQVYFTLDKKTLPATFQNPDVKINPEDIPKNAKVKDLWIGWD